MIQVRGKFIILTAQLMSLYKDKLKKADDYLFSESGKHYHELDPEAWYDVSYNKAFLEAYVEASPSGEKALATLGRLIYPEIKKTAGLPPNIKTPLDFIAFEEIGFKESLRGPELGDRKYLKREDGEVIFQTKMDPLLCKVQEGIFVGLLGLAGIKGCTVKQEKCCGRGDAYCEFHVSW
jgi:predicted hydrocarbon binding protein